MDTSTLQGMAKLKAALQEVADATSLDTTLRQALVLLDVATMTTPITQYRLGERHGISKATTSRIVANLAGTGGDVKHMAGYGLLDVNMDSADMRNRYVSLSAKGARVAARVVARAFG